MLNNNQVSFDDELLILTDSDDSPSGYDTKINTHSGKGILHRAFSIFVFNSNNELLIQKRSAEKPLWPLFWSNSVCSHPRKGEDYDTAIARRLEDEIGMAMPLNFLFKFQYQADYKENGKHLGSENELCSVYFGRSDDNPVINKSEIADWKYIGLDDLENEIEENPDQYTPWFKTELKAIKASHIKNIFT